MCEGSWRLEEVARSKMTGVEEEKALVGRVVMGPSHKAWASYWDPNSDLLWKQEVFRLRVRERL